MVARRLGALVLASVLTWSVAGLDSHPNSPWSQALAPSLASPTGVRTVDLPDGRGSFVLLGDPDDIADAPDKGVPPDSTEGSTTEGGKNGSSLLLRIIDAVGSWLGLK